MVRLTFDSSAARQPLGRVGRKRFLYWWDGGILVWDGDRPVCVAAVLKKYLRLCVPSTVGIHIMTASFIRVTRWQAV